MLNNPHLVRVEETWLLAYEFVPGGGSNGFLKVEPIGAQHRNEVAAQGTLSVAASAASGTALGPTALTLDSANGTPSSLELFVWNGSDAAITVTLEQAMTVGGSAKYAANNAANAVAVGAGAGIVLNVQGAALGDDAPQVSGKTTSAATSGGTVTVQLRYA